MAGAPMEKGGREGPAPRAGQKGRPEAAASPGGFEQVARLKIRSQTTKEPGALIP